jgi:hypothetical protein
MPDTPDLQMDSTKSYETGGTWFQDPVKNPDPKSYHRTGQVAFSLEVDAEHQPRPLALEIDEIEARHGSG